jgi:hypothetical protein
VERLGDQRLLERCLKAKRGQDPFPEDPSSGTEP